MTLQQEVKFLNLGYNPHVGEYQPCVDDLPIAYIDWYGDCGAGYSDAIKWSRVRFWRIEE